MNNFAIKVLTAEPGRTHLFSVGQAGCIIKSASGQLLGIDLYLSECVERIEGHVGFKRLLPKILDPFELEFDCLIATHSHYDHFDMDSLPQMMSNHKTSLYASVNCEKEAGKLSMTGRRITYVKPGESYDFRAFHLDFVSCDHGVSAPDAVGVVITVDHKKIYIAGDTALRLDRVEEYQRRGPFHIMIAPINGAYGNLNEQECAVLSNALTPGLTIPCHYGMFASHGGNPGLFMDIMANDYPANQFLLLSMGEKLTLEDDVY